MRDREDYRLGDFIGMDGAIEIWEASDPETGSPLIIETLGNEVTGTSLFSSSLIREYRILSALSHRGLPRVTGLFTSSAGTHTIVLDCGRPRTSIEEWVSGCPSQVDIEDWFKDLLLVIEYMHNRGIAHRRIGEGYVWAPSGTEHDESTAVLTGFAEAFVSDGSVLLAAGNAALTDNALPRDLGGRDLAAAGELCARVLLGRVGGSQSHQELREAIVENRIGRIGDTFRMVLGRILAPPGVRGPQSVRELRLSVAERGGDSQWLAEQPYPRSPSRAAVPRIGVRLRVRELLRSSDALQVAPILVVRGERGSGKSWLARQCAYEAAIHGREFMSCTISAEFCALAEDVVSLADLTRKRLARDHACSRSEALGGAACLESMSLSADQTCGRPWLLFADDVDRLDSGDLSALLDTYSRVASIRRGSLLVATCVSLPLVLLRCRDFETSCPATSVGTAGFPVDALRFEDLDTFTHQETAVHLTELTGAQVPSEVVSWFRKHTCGNPLFVAGLSDSLIGSGVLSVQMGQLVLDTRAAETDGLPRTAKSMAMDRIGTLSALAQRTAEVLSLGPGLDRSMLPQVAGLDDCEVDSALQELIDRGVLECSDGALGVEFASGFVRETLYRQIDSSEAQRLHGLVVHILQDRVSSGCRVDDRDTAWHVLRSLDRTGATQDALELVLALAHEGRCGEAVEYAKMLEDRLSSRDELLPEDDDTLLKLAGVYLNAGRASDSARVFAGLLSRSESRPNIDETHAAWSLGRSLALSGRPAEAEIAFERGLHSAQTKNDVHWSARIMASLGIVHQMRGEFTSVERLADESIGLLKAHPDAGLMASAHNSKGNALLAMCRWDDSKKCFERAIELAAECGQLPLSALVSSNLGLAHLFLGEWKKASEQFSTSVALARRTGSSYCMLVSLGCVGVLRLRQAALDEAEACFREALRLAAVSDDTWSSALLVSNLGEVEHRRGNDELALHLYDRSRDLLSRSGALDDLPELLRRRSETLLVLGRGSEALSVAREGRTCASSIGNGLEEANCRVWEAAAMAAEGCPSEAEDAFGSAIAQLDELGAKYDSAVARLESAKWYRRAGCGERAALRLEEALRLLESLGAHKLIQKARREMRQVRSGHRPLASGLPLDPEHLATLYESGRLLAEPITASDLAADLADLIFNAVSADIAGVVLMERDGDASGYHRSTDARRTSSPTRVTEIVAALASDLRDEPMTLTVASCDLGASALLDELDVCSLSVFPLRRADTLLGVFYASLKSKTEKTRAQNEKFLDALAVQCVPALENARLRAGLLDEVESLRIEVDGRYSFSNIVGRSLPMQRLFSMLGRVARSSATILIEGESGTGKELVARAIHHNGPRRDQRFIAQNCAALPEQLLESELFGHVRGAFTGAHRDKRGLFEAADCGTFFLDEIADMPIGLQVKLLRVLQDGEIRKVGATEPTNVDIRVIAATNKSLSDEVAAGRFREDLFYRLNVVRIVTPPLRIRREDIPLLVQHFLSSHVKRGESAVRGFSDEAMKLLMSYNWPGNVRELENEVERCIALAADSKVIHPPMLSERILSASGATRSTRPFVSGFSLKQIVEDVEKRAIAQVLSEQEGNKSRAARILGLSRQGLIKKIARYGMVNEHPQNSQ